MILLRTLFRFLFLRRASEGCVFNWIFYQDRVEREEVSGGCGRSRGSKFVILQLTGTAAGEAPIPGKAPAFPKCNGLISKSESRVRYEIRPKKVRNRSQNRGSPFRDLLARQNQDKQGELHKLATQLRISLICRNLALTRVCVQFPLYAPPRKRSGTKRVLCAYRISCSICSIFSAAENQKQQKASRRRPLCLIPGLSSVNKPPLLPLFSPRRERGGI